MDRGERGMNPVAMTIIKWTGKLPEIMSKTENGVRYMCSAINKSAISYFHKLSSLGVNIKFIVAWFNEKGAYCISVCLNPLPHNSDFLRT